MSGAALDRLLAVLLVAELATGLLTLRAGVPATAPLFWVHGILAGSLLVAALEKLRRSLRPAIARRRWARLVVAGLVSLLLAAALAGGFAWVASGRILSIGPWTVLTLHVWAALAVIPFVAIHLLPRRFRVLRTPPPARRRISRRGPRSRRDARPGGTGVGHDERAGRDARRGPSIHWIAPPSAGWRTTDDDLLR
jgi:hypothetical protein